MLKFRNKKSKYFIKSHYSLVNFVSGMSDKMRNDSVFTLVIMFPKKCFINITKSCIWKDKTATPERFTDDQSYLHAWLTDV